MNANPYPTDLPDAAWDLIKDLLPPPKPGGATARWRCGRWSMRSFMSLTGASHGACSRLRIRSGPVATGIAAKGAPAGPGNAATTPGVPRCARRLDATHSPRRAVSTAPVARPRHWARRRRGPTQREPAGSWPGSGAPVKSCGGSGAMGAIGDSWWHGGVNSGAASCVSRCVL
jgi:hypothetical protein